MIRSFAIGLVLAATLVQVGCGNGAATRYDLDSTGQNFGQKILYNNKVDIVFIVDNSTSMAQHQDRLNSQIPTLVSVLQGLKMDYHIVSISTSMGLDGNGGQFLGSPKVLTPTTPNLQALLQQRIALGDTGSNNERGLYSMETVLSPSYLTTDGQGFLRDDALLAVIALSDENDKSGKTASYYASFLDKLKPADTEGRKSWIFNFIGVLENSSACRTFNDYSEVGTIQMQLADLSGGNKESLCSNSLASAVTNIKARIVQILTDFYLKTKPIKTTLKIAVNGSLVQEDANNGWTYVEENGKYIIRFHGNAIPPADADIRVDFTPTENG
ncbi:MAG: hypothetical protein JSU04_17425 [Bdellovibrionales bacterium]|nr:hypothetical protein [Bdellovibrionales bacterium]